MEGALEGGAVDSGYVVHGLEGLLEVEGLFPAQGGEGWVENGPAVAGGEVVFCLCCVLIVRFSYAASLGI